MTSEPTQASASGTIAIRNERLGEVVAASTEAFTAQCHRLGEPPPLGSLVLARDEDVEIYGVAHHAATGSLDPSRPVLALGAGAESEEEIQINHPELAQLLRTEFSAIVLGHKSGGLLRQHPPPRPARLHGFVRQALPAEVREFTQALHFLPTLVNARAPSADAATAACLRLAAQAYDDADAFLLRAGKELARLLAQDAPRLTAVLRALRG